MPPQHHTLRSCCHSNVKHATLWLIASGLIHIIWLCIIQVVPGELSIVTGVPNSGKSEWIDALICNLAQQHGWSFALCSMEKKVRQQ